MNKKIFILMLSLACVLNARADNKVNVSPVTIPQGGMGSFDIELSNDVDFTAFSMSLSLPEGVSYVSFAEGNRFDGHSVDDGEKNGKKTFAALSLQSKVFKGSNGTLISVTIMADEAMEQGTIVNATLSEIIFTTPDEIEYNLQDVDITITIGEPADLRTVLDETSTTAPEAASGVDVRVRRTIAAGEWNTICLPFAMTEAQTKQAFGNDVQLADFTGYDVTENADAEIAGITVHFQGVTAIEANHPYIIKVAAPVTEFTVDGVDITPEEEPTNATIKRTRKAWSEMTGTYTAGFTVPEQTLFLSGGKFWYSTGQTKMKAFRAYFDFYDVLAEVENASVKMVVNFGDETGLSSVSSSIENDQSSMYDIQGRKVQGQNAQKGIYIINGKKILK